MGKRQRAAQRLARRKGYRDGVRIPVKQSTDIAQPQQSADTQSAASEPAAQPPAPAPTAVQQPRDKDKERVHSEQTATGSLAKITRTRDDKTAPSPQPASGLTAEGEFIPNPKLYQWLMSQAKGQEVLVSSRPYPEAPKLLSAFNRTGKRFGKAARITDANNRFAEKLHRMAGLQRAGTNDMAMRLSSMFMRLVDRATEYGISLHIRYGGFDAKDEMELGVTQTSESIYIHPYQKLYVRDGLGAVATVRALAHEMSHAVDPVSYFPGEWDSEVAAEVAAWRMACIYGVNWALSTADYCLAVGYSLKEVGYNSRMCERVDVILTRLLPLTEAEQAAKRRVVYGHLY